MRWLIVFVFAFGSVFAFGCGNDHAASPDAAGDAAADTPPDAAPTPLALMCAVTLGDAIAPNPCPAPSGADGHADFCFRPQWPGVTSVDVYGGFGQATDWTQPYVSLTNDGSGTFTGGAALVDGSYPYLFRVHGTVDNLVKNGQYLLDQTNASFVPAPAQAPGGGGTIPRAVSQLVVPQVASTLHHLTGKVIYGATAQPCFAIALEIGELRAGSTVLAEHDTANFVESGTDGSFELDVADGEVMAVVRYPFELTGMQAPYPDPATTPTLGYARTTQQIAGADLALDALDVTYSETDYSAMSPTGGTGSLPQTFALSVLPAAQTASVAVSATNIAGNDAKYQSTPSTTTAVTWDGTFGGGQQAMTGTTYYWGTWQQGATWTAESLLFPIVFQ
ncbi:MAG TPA: hypothetical protein VGF94_21510 [Kofleriaceae bacterium]|jgi:hypothetical protein